MKKVAVFFGGNSNEREVSVITGLLAVNLLKGRYEVMPVYLPTEGGFLLGKSVNPRDYSKPNGKTFTPVCLGDSGLYSPKGKKISRIDVALNCCHGGRGEDGTLSALLHFYNIKSASPDAPACALFMNKEYTKTFAKGLGIPVLPSVCVREEEWKGEELSVAFPAVVKPCNLGSSIGVNVVRTAQELKLALTLAFELDTAALVESYVENRREVNCAAYCKRGEVALSQIEEVFSGEEVLTFAEKYEKGDRRPQMPALISSEEEKIIREIVKTLYTSLDCKGVVRADFLLADGKVYFNEMNAIPGSLSYYLFAENLTKGREFLCELIEEAKPPRVKRRVDTHILSGNVFQGAKGCKKTE